MITIGTFTKNYTANANAISPVINVTCSKTGYTLLGVVGVSTGNAGIVVQTVKRTTSTNVECYFRNVFGSQLSTTAEIYALFVKS